MDKKFIDNPIEAYEKLQEENERLKSESQILSNELNKYKGVVFKQLEKLERHITYLQEIKGIVTALYMNEWLQHNETARQSVQLLQEKIAECEVNE